MQLLGKVHCSNETGLTRPADVTLPGAAGCFHLSPTAFPAKKQKSIAAVPAAAVPRWEGTGEGPRGVWGPHVGFCAQQHRPRRGVPPAPGAPLSAGSPRELWSRNNSSCTERNRAIMGIITGRFHSFPLHCLRGEGCSPQRCCTARGATPG